MNYRIVCTEQEPASQPPQHAHIVAVGVGDDPNSAEDRFTLDEVIKKMDAGNKFYTKGVNSGKVARVEKYNCKYCRRTYIRSEPDATTDNNLDNIRTCNWK